MQRRLFMQSVTRARLLFGVSSSALALVIGVSACSSSSSGNSGDGGGGGSSSGSSSGGSSSGASSSGAGSSGGSSSGVAEGGPSLEGGGGCTTLTVNNFESWCSISIAGTALQGVEGLDASAGIVSSKTPLITCVSPGSLTLVAEPASNMFELGPDPWLYISGPGGTDSGIAGTVSDAGATATSTVSITVGSASVCVFACCPFTSGSGCTGLTNPCP
jgi:hypothetical protein